MFNLFEKLQFIYFQEYLKNGKNLWINYSLQTIPSCDSDSLNVETQGI